MPTFWITRLSGIVTGGGGSFLMLRLPVRLSGVHSGSSVFCEMGDAMRADFRAEDLDSVYDVSSKSLNILLFLFLIRGGLDSTASCFCVLLFRAPSFMLRSAAADSHNQYLFFATGIARRIQRKNDGYNQQRLLRLSCLKSAGYSCGVSLRSRL